MVSRIVRLVWRNADRSLVEEAWQYFDRPDLDVVRAEAHRDGVAGRFGRAFEGAAGTQTIEEWDGWASREALDPPSFAGLADAAEEPPRRPLSLEAVEGERWWAYDAAFGPGTMVGVHLRRCAAIDDAVAVQSAELVGESIAHQGTLYSVTPSATRAILALLSELAPEPRQVLAGWLDVVASSVAESPEDELDPEGLRAAYLEGGLPEWMVEGMVESGLVHARVAAEHRAIFVEERERLEALAREGALGPQLRAWIDAP